MLTGTTCDASYTSPGAELQTAWLVALEYKQCTPQQFVHKLVFGVFQNAVNDFSRESTWNQTVHPGRLNPRFQGCSSAITSTDFRRSALMILQRHFSVKREFVSLQLKRNSTVRGPLLPGGLAWLGWSHSTSSNSIDSVCLHRAGPETFG